MLSAFLPLFCSVAPNRFLIQFIKCYSASSHVLPIESMLHQYELSRYCKGLTSNMLFVLHIFLLIIQMQKLLFLVLFRYIRLCDATELNADNFSSARKQTRNTIRLLEKYKIVILLFVSCAHFQAEDGGGEARGGGFSSRLALMPFLIDWLVIPCFVTYFLAGVSTRQL